MNRAPIVLAMSAADGSRVLPMARSIFEDQDDFRSLEARRKIAQRLMASEVPRRD